MAITNCPMIQTPEPKNFKLVERSLDPSLPTKSPPAVKPSPLNHRYWPDAGRAIHWGGVGRDKKSHLARVLAWPLRPQASIALSWSRAPGDPASFVFASTESSLPREGTVCPMPQMEGLRGWRKEIQSLFPIYSYHARLGSNIH